MIEKLAVTLKELGLTKNDSLLVAFSGGLDSTVLSHALIALGFPLSLVHVNFQLRGEASEGDAKFCENFALQRQVPFYLRRCNTEKFAQEKKLSIQEAARELRYSYFKALQTEHKFSAVLTAHHADDNLETFLINFARSGGLKGLKGIPQKRDFYVRPLLGLTRKELENYATSHKISWREDASNASEKYQRNKYRLKLIPQWKEIEADLLAKASRSLALLQEQNSAFEALLQEMLDAHLDLTGSVETLNTKHLRSKAYWPSLLRFWLEDKGPWDYLSLENLWQSENGKSLESENFILSHREGHYFLSPKKEIGDLESHQISIDTRNSAKLEFQKLAPENYPEVPSSQNALLDFDKLSFPLLLRPWQAGDRFKPLGLSGSKKVSDYLNDIKISGPAKKEQYVLCSGDDIVWLVGNRIDHRYRVTNSTKTIYFVRTL
jgi:tRNA(Ile)-lysidine synthase